MRIVLILLYSCLSKTVNSDNDEYEINAIELSCNFEEIDESYGCKALNLEVNSRKTFITSVTGEHRKSHNNDNVAIFYAFNPDITFIPKRIGVNFPQLKIFLITKSSLKYIEWRDFKYLRHLHTLSLHDNKITHVSQCAFQYLESLVRVILDGNHLVALSENLFENLPNLEYFSASFNNITTLEADLFANNLQLKEVVMRNNHLNKIEVNFQTMKTIEYIDFGANICFKGSYVCCNGTYFKMFLTNLTRDCGGPELC